MDKPQHAPTDTISFRLLTDIKLRDLTSLQRALTMLHEEYQVPNVAISSIPVKEWLFDVLPPPIHPGTFDDPPQDDDRFLLCLTSSKSGRSPNETSLVHACCVEKIPGYFSGVGDLFSALLLGHFRPAEDKPSAMPEMTSLSIATSFALAKTCAVLGRTYSHSQTLPEGERQSADDEKDSVDPLRRTRRVRGRELRLVQSQDIFTRTGLDHSYCLKHWPTFWSPLLNGS